MANEQKQCPNGHYYNQSLAECPFCKPSNAGFGDFPGGNIGENDRINSENFPDWGNDSDATQIAPGVKDSKISPVVGWLVCTEGHDTGKDFRLHAENNSVGRGSDQDVRLNDPDNKVSREHFTVTYDPHHDMYYACMGRGKAIVYLNDYPLGNGMVAIKKGDKFKVAGFTLVFIPLEQKDVKWEWS